ncbi:MAG: TonB-dependent receptor domain-containing protein [Burkholderiales bacterium]
MKLKLRVLPAAVAGALATGMYGTAVAQQAAPAAKKAEEKVERIEVTGSRIPSANLESSSPITTIDAAAIKTDGLRSVENLLNNLPQVFAAQGATISNGSTGTATVNLRGLGATRTLVLVNGRRLPAGSPRTFAADLNQIPAPLIKRVEILTGGAGSIYGSDAVSGVVNFIMNDKFEGVQVDTSYSFYNHDQNGGPVADMIRARAISNSAQFMIPGNKSADGKIGDVSLLMGSNFNNNKGNATVFFNYKKEEPLLQSERDFSACSIGNATSASPATINGVAFGPGFRCGGSGTSFPGRFINLVTGANLTVADAAGTTRPYVGANDQYNFGPLNYFQRPSERYQFNAFVNYDLNDSMKLYSEFSMHDDRTVAQIAPSGAFGFDASGADAIRCDNPLLSASWRAGLGCTGTTGVANDLFIFRRNVEGGGRQDDIRHTSYRMVLGVKGDLGKSWGYDAYAYDGKVVYQQTYKNDFSIARTALALDAVRDASGAIVCRSGPPCVPWNIWSLGGVTPAALNYIQTPGFQKGFTEQKVQGVTLNGDLTDYGFKSPGAKNGVGVAFGLERRVERLQLDTDTAFSTGDLAGQGGPTIGLGGSYTVNEVFAEVRAPLIEGGQFAELLSINGSWRNSDYSTGPRTNAYGFGLEWAPIKELRTRASYQKAVRAANVIDLFTAQGVALFDLAVDPCGPSRTATLAQCQRTGITATQYGSAVLDSPAGQYNYIQGGNRNLKPEESKSYTIGAVFQIGRNFSGSVDYFSIEVDKTIGSAPPGTILRQCLDTGRSDFCSLIQRDRVGTLWATPQGFITATNQNLGRLTTKGVDINLDYFYKLPAYGALKFNLTGTYLSENKAEPIKGLGEYDCKGLHGASCGVPTPEWRHKFRTTWETPWNFDLALTWRHIGSVDQEGTSSNPLLSNTAIAPADRTLGKRDYFDLAGSYNLTKKITLRAGINNLLDKDPPLSGLVGAGFGNGNTYPQVYDALGRRVFFNVTARF